MKSNYLFVSLDNRICITVLKHKRNYLKQILKTTSKKIFEIFINEKQIPEGI